MGPLKTHGATLPQQELTQPAGGCPSGLRPEDLLQGGHEGANPHVGRRVATDYAMDSAIAGTSHSPGVSESILGELTDSVELCAGSSRQDSVVLGEKHGQKVLTRLDVYNLLLEESKNKHFRLRPSDLSRNERLDVINKALGRDYKLTISENELATAVGTFISKSEALYIKCNRHMPYFLNKHKHWLGQVFVNGILIQPSSTSSSSASEQNNQTSPRTDKFQKLGLRQQHRLKRNLAVSWSTEPQAKVLKAFVDSITSKSGEKLTSKASQDLERVVTTCLETPTKATTVLNVLQQSTQLRPYTPDEALAILIDRKFTVDTYKFLQTDAKERGFSLYPPYYKVMEARKSCYPSEEVEVSERQASISLQSLLQHTFQRIVYLCDEILLQICEEKSFLLLNCTFEGSWGFDGSSGQSLYKQTFTDEDQDENSLFATTFIPLQITDQNNVIVWRNSTSQSYRLCRPLRIQYRKETRDLIIDERKWVDEQINMLTPLSAQTSKNHRIEAISKLYLTVIDGKVLNTILNTPSQMRCPFCGLTATNFNDLDKAFQQPIRNQEVLLHGISPMHAWIRALEFLLHIGYKSVVKQWRIKQSSQEGQMVQQRKKAIQAEIRQKMGLLVDVVKPNAGTTNDGNSARTAMSDKHRSTFASILGVEHWLLDDLHAILIALSCGLPLDPGKFGEFCHDLALKYVQKYKWHPMTVTIHKILIHGKAIIEASRLPLGMLSEQAAESRNKLWRHDREHHSRKMDRKKTILDLFHRALESSDPIISSHHKRKKNNLPLPQTVISLLKPAVVEDLQMHTAMTTTDEQELTEEEKTKEQRHVNKLVLSADEDIFED